MSQQLSNTKHEQFAQLIADGQFATDAYHNVYNCKRNTAARNGERLLRNALARARVHFLKAENAQKKGLERSEKRIILAEIARNNQLDPRCRIQAIQEDNRMTGESEDNKQDTSFNVSIITP